jgi:hypothetical protein
MTEIRVVGLLRMKDPEIGVPILKQIAGIASGIEGVEVWEAFSDEGQDLIYLNERFGSEEAYLEYESAVDAQGLRPRVGEAFEVEHLLLLSPLGNDRLRADLDALGTVQVQMVASADSAR